MKYYLGIDGGGSKTTYIVIDNNKKVIEEFTSLGTSIDTYSIDEVKNRLVENINKIKYKLSGVYAGLGGITSNEDIKMINKILSSCPNVKGKVNSGNDVTNALAGALNNKDGIILIAGTGSVAYGRYKNKIHRAGGYGYKEGDIGSSYYIGHQALRYLSRVIDKRQPATDLSDELIKVTGCNTFSKLAKYFHVATRSEIAQLAKVVTKYPKNYYARDIILDCIGGVLSMIDAVYEQCGFKKANLSIIGSLGNANTMYKKLLLSGLNKNITFTPKIYEASFGAALLAYDLK